MGLAEQQYLDRLRAVLAPDLRGTGQVEEPSEKQAATHSLGRSTGFLTEKQPTMRATGKGTVIGGSIGTLAGTALRIATKKKYGPVAKVLRGSAGSLGAPVGAAIGAGIGSFRQRKSGYKSHDEPVLRASGLAGAAIGAAGVLNRHGISTETLPHAAIMAGLGAATGVSGAAGGLSVARAVGRKRSGQSRERRPTAGAVGEVLGLAATGSKLGLSYGTRKGVKTLKVPGVHQKRLADIFARKTWAKKGLPFSKNRRVAKAAMRGQQHAVRSFHAGHFRPIERRSAGVGAIAGAGLALGLLAVESRRRKKRMKTDDHTKS